MFPMIFYAGLMGLLLFEHAAPSSTDTTGSELVSEMYEPKLIADGAVMEVKTDVGGA